MVLVSYIYKRSIVMSVLTDLRDTLKLEKVRIHEEDNCPNLNFIFGIIFLPCMCKLVHSGI